MDFKRFLTICAAAVLVFGVIACKKDDDDETSLSFDGTPSFYIPGYIQVGETYTLKHDVVSRSDEDESTLNVGIIWKISELSICDTVRIEDNSDICTDYIFEVPDTLTTITVSCSAFASGYTTSSYTLYSVIVKDSGEGKSLQGADPAEGSKSFTDSRDGKTYHYTTLEGKDWMTENLAYEGAGKPFANCKAMWNIFGGFYCWSDAVKCCPEGWTLPTNAEFLSMNNSFINEKSTDAFAIFNKGAGNHMADAYFNSIKLWEYWPEVSLKNTSGLNLIPTGYVTIEDDTFYFNNFMNYNILWTADEASSDKAYYRAIYVKEDYILCGSASKDDFATTVRCVRDSN